MVGVIGRVQTDDQVRRSVPLKSLRMLDGCIVDYDTSLLNTGFVINNPHAMGTCGCGTSFSVLEAEATTS